MDAEGPRHATVTPDDHGPILQIVAWFMMVAMILMVMMRLALRLTATRKPGVDDLMAVIAMLLSVGGTVAISISVNNGLGKRASIRDMSRTDALQQSAYASSLLYILTITFAKLSTLMLVVRLSSNVPHRRVTMTLIAISTGWGIASIFADAFRCSLPRPWDNLGGDCLDIASFWEGIGAIDIATDVALIALPIWIFGGLQMKLASKVIVIGAFACRVLVIAAAIARLVFVGRLRHTTDLWFDIDFQTATQCQQALAVIVASAPALKNFVDRAASGMLNVSLEARTGATYGIESYRMTEMSKSSRRGSEKPSEYDGQGGNRASVVSLGSRRSIVAALTRSRSRQNSQTPAVPQVSRNNLPYTQEEPADQISVEDARSSQGIIRVNKEWTLEEYGAAR